MRLYSSTRIYKALGIGRERLRSWIDLGYTKPTFLAEGRGTRHGFTIMDVYHIYIFYILMEDRINRKKASEIAKEIMRQVENDYPKVTIFSYKTEYIEWAFNFKNVIKKVELCLGRANETD